MSSAPSLASYQAGFYAPGRGCIAKYPELWHGCVGAWNPGLGNSGLVLRDWSGNGNHGTLINGPTWQVSDGLYVINYDGNNDRVAFERPVALGTVHSAAFTWYTITSDNPIVAGTFSPQYYLLYPADAQGWYYNAGGHYVLLSLANAAWKTVKNTTILTRSGTSLTWWVNGVKQATLTLPGNNPMTVDTIGSFSGGTYYFSGQIGQLMLWNRVLSDSEAALMFRTKCMASYERAPRKTYSLPGPTFKPTWASQRPQMIGTGIR